MLHLSQSFGASIEYLKAGIIGDEGYLDRLLTQMSKWPSSMKIAGDVVRLRTTDESEFWVHPSISTNNLN